MPKKKVERKVKKTALKKPKTPKVKSNIGFEYKDDPKRPRAKPNKKG